ncbi:MAG: hypothetical protein ACE5ID_05440 [Acidobacteriota bacterium]
MKKLNRTIAAIAFAAVALLSAGPVVHAGGLGVDTVHSRGHMVPQAPTSVNQRPSLFTVAFSLSPSLAAALLRMGLVRLPR